MPKKASSDSFTLFHAVVSDGPPARQPNSTVEACNIMANRNLAHISTYHPLLGNFSRAWQIVHRDFVESFTRATAAQTHGPFELPAPVLPVPVSNRAPAPNDTDARRRMRLQGQLLPHAPAISSTRRHSIRRSTGRVVDHAGRYTRIVDRGTTRVSEDRYALIEKGKRRPS